MIPLKACSHFGSAPSVFPLATTPSGLLWTMEGLTLQSLPSDKTNTLSRKEGEKSELQRVPRQRLRRATGQVGRWSIRNVTITQNPPTIHTPKITRGPRSRRFNPIIELLLWNYASRARIITP